MPRTGFCLLIIAAVLFLTACGPSGPQMAPASGKVLYRGKPLAGATIKFTPKGKGRPSTGISDEEGRFTLKAFEEGDGAVVAKHTVTVFKYARPKVQPTGKSDSGALIFRNKAEETAYYNPPSLLPEKYGNIIKSPLRAIVTADGPNDITLSMD